MKKYVFVSISNDHKQELTEELRIITDVIRAHSHIPLVFANEYKLQDDDFRGMMNTALSQIDKSCMVLAEVTNQAIGIGIELGYAKAKNKQIVYLYKNTSNVSTTVLGIADKVICYSHNEDLKKQLVAYIQRNS